MLLQVSTYILMRVSPANSCLPIPPEKNSNSKLNLKPLPHPLPINIKHRRRGRNNHTREPKHTDPPPIPNLIKQHRRKKGDYTPHQAPKYTPSRNRAGGVLLKTVDVVVLCGVEDEDLAYTVEEGGDDGDHEMGAGLDGPCEPEEARGDEEGADVGEWQAVFGERGRVVFLCELVVDGVDFGDEEPD
jgi:hypothetical protein